MKTSLSSRTFEAFVALGTRARGCKKDATYKHTGWQKHSSRPISRVYVHPIRGLTTLGRPSAGHVEEGKNKLRCDLICCAPRDNRSRSFGVHCREEAISSRRNRKQNAPREDCAVCRKITCIWWLYSLQNFSKISPVDFEYVWPESALCTWLLTRGGQAVI